MSELLQAEAIWDELVAAVVVLECLLSGAPLLVVLMLRCWGFEVLVGLSESNCRARFWMVE